MSTSTHYRLGHLDAEIDRKRHYLDHETFVETPAIQDAMNEDCPFVCGRKGAGKTAVAFRLADTYHYRHVVDLVEKDYSDLHTLSTDEILASGGFLNNPHETIELIFYRLWSIILHLSVVSACASGADGEGDPELYSEVREIWGKLNPNRLDPIQLARGLLRKAIEECAPQAAFLTALSHKLDTVTREPRLARAMEIVSVLSPSESTLISIDTQERYDISPPRILPLRGMCTAVREFCEREYYSGLTIKCFLPVELTDQVFYDNKFKYDDLSTFLTWGYADLIEFIARRYSRLLRQTMTGEAFELGQRLKREVDKLHEARDRTNQSWRRIWNLFAPQTIKNRLSQQEEAPTYFLRHTQRRPRECLSAMNHIVERAAQDGSLPKLSGQAIREGIHHRENLKDVVNSALSIFRPNFTSKPLQEIIGRIFANEPTLLDANRLRAMTARAIRDIPQWSRSEVHDFLVQVLIRSGLIGVIKEETPAIGLSQLKYYVTEFEYGAPGTLAFNEQSRFGVHSILADWLDLHGAERDRALVLPVTEREFASSG